MTAQKSFKRKVRARMAKTGESYTAARRQLIASGERPATAAPYEPPVSDEAAREATGRGWQEWFAILDEWGAVSRRHPEIARWLQEEQGVAGWWAQSVTVAYEQARGLRAPGQRADGGFSATASKTVAVPVARLYEAFLDRQVRERWLPGAGMRIRTATPPKYARFDWEDGSTRVIVGFTAKEDAKSQVGLEHERLPDPETAEEMKGWWRERVAALKEVLEAE